MVTRLEQRIGNVMPGSVGRAQLTPQSTRSRTGNGRAIGTGLEQLGVGLVSYAENAEALERDQNQRIDAMRAVKARGRVIESAMGRVDDLDPLSPDYEKDVYNIYREESEAAVEAAGFTSGEAADVFRIQQEEAAVKARMAAFDHKRQSIVEDAAATREDLEAAAMNRARENPDDVDGIFEQFEQDALSVDSLLPDHVRKQRNADLRDGLILSRAEGLAEQGRVQEANDFLDSAAAEGVDPSHVRQMKRRVRQIESNARADFQRATAGQVAELAHLVGTGQAGPREIDAARDSGLFRGREAMEWQLRSAYTNVAKAQAKKGRALELAAERVSAGTAGQKDVDRVFEHELSSLPEDATTDDKMDVAMRLTRETSYVPSPIKDMVANAGRSNDAEKVAMAAETHRTLKEQNQFVDTGASGQTELVAEMIAAGADPNEAAETIITAARTRDPARSKKVWNETVKDQDPDWNEIIADNNPHLDEDDVEANIDMRADADLLAQQYHSAGTPVEDAQVYAAKVVGRKYGTSTMFDVSKAQQYAPEIMLRETTPFKALYEPEDFVKFLEEDLVTGLQGVGVTPGVSEAGQEPWEVQDGLPPAIVVTDRQTSRDLAAGRQPTYEVRVRNEYGGYVPVRTTDPGQPFMRYTLPTAAEFGTRTGVEGRRETQRAKARAHRERDPMHWTPALGLPD